MEDVKYALYIPLVLQAFPPGFTDQGMVFFLYERFQHFRTAEALHPERLPSVSSHPHHQGPGRIITECHVKDRGCRKHGLQDLPHLIHVYGKKESLRQYIFPIGIQKDAVFLLHTSHRISR